MSKTNDTLASTVVRIVRNTYMVNIEHIVPHKHQHVSIGNVSNLRILIYFSI